MAWVACAASVLLFVGTAFAPGRFEDFPVENPFGGGPAAEIAGGLGFVLLLLAAVASLWRWCSVSAAHATRSVSR